jgi:hypothetical protein
MIVDCEHGSVVIPSYTLVNVFDKDNQLIKTFDGKTSHYENFLDAVRSRKSTDLHADILQGHVSSGLCHTANISYRLGKQVQPDELRASLRDNKELDETLGRMQEHLGANAVDLKKTPVTLGPALNFDPNTERFKDNESANGLLATAYRAPFVVPKMV